MTADDPTTRLLEALEGLDLTSADGRAGISTLLSEIERACPGAILRQAARIELRALGWGKMTHVGSEREYVLHARVVNSPGSST